MSNRISVDEYFLRAAEWATLRGTCARRKVGCVLTNHRSHILATGYNGVASGAPHCIEPAHSCPGAKAPSGTGLDLCEAIHAEQNALLQCHNVFEIHTCYVTHSPCITCVKLIAGTSCQRIVFREKYAHDDASKALWMKLRRHSPHSWIHLPHGD